MIRQKKTQALFIALSLGLSFTMHTLLVGYDNHHFYRASYFSGEPRFEKPWLSTGELSIAEGLSRTGITNKGHKTRLLDSWGTHNMQQLGNNVPGLDPDNPLDNAIIELGALPSRDRFGTLSFAGNFRIIEANATYIQNFAHGIFIQLHMPIRRLSLSNIRFFDCSPQDNVSPNIYTPEWQTFLNQFYDIMARHSLSIYDYTHTGIGDTSFLLGWTNNYEETEVLDYIDTTIKTGILTPTARAKNEDLLFDIPLGYNKHVGFPITLDCSLGLFEWFTAGAHLGGLFFLDKTKSVRMKTGENQSGLIKLAKYCAKIHEGPLWDIGGYVKIDHAGQALSLIIGCSYANKTSDTVYPHEPTIFKPSIVNSDQIFKGWTMQTLHILLEYDLSREENRLGPRISAFYNHVLSGKRIFKTGIWGGSFGLDIRWSLD